MTFAVDGSALEAVQFNGKCGRGHILQWVAVCSSGVAWCGVEKGSMEVLADATR